MTLLLDTHAMLWFAAGDARLSAIARTAIENPENTCWVSHATFWELAIKVSRGNISFPGPFPQWLQETLPDQEIQILSPALADYHELARLPFLPASNNHGDEHKDPFDRMLVAQVLRRGWTLVSRDAVLDRYGISRLW